MNKILTMLALTSTLIMAGGDIVPTSAPVAVIVEDTQDFYVGLNTAIGTGTEFDKLEWFTATTIGAQAGYVAYRNGAFSTALEARYNTNTQNMFDNYSVAAYVKPIYSFTDASVYGLLGYSSVDTETVDLGDADGFAYGAGVSTPFMFNTELYVDYVRHDEVQKDEVTVGINYKF